MKKLIMFFCLIICLSSTVFSSNMQKIYTIRDDVYHRVDELCMRAGVIGPSSFSPLSAKALMIALERIDPEELESEEREEYEELYSILTEDESIFKSGIFSFNITPAVNLGVNIADYSAFDYGNTQSASPAISRKENTLIPYRYEDALISAGLKMNFGNHIHLDARFDVKNSNHVMYESTLGFLFTSVTENKGMAAEIPHRAGASIGNDYASFIFGRFPHSIGSGITGNLLIGDNFDYQEIAALSLMSNYFTYNISVTRFDQQSLSGNKGFERNKFSGPQQIRVLHRFDINIIDKVRLAINFATLYNGSSIFDLRFFYPFMISHNYYNYAGGTAKESYDEANNILAVEAEWNIASGLTTTAQVAIDQFQMPWEKQADLPLAFGAMGNLKYSTRVWNGTLTSWIEAVYTNPYMYLNGKYYTENDIELIDYNLDLVVGYHSCWLDDYGYSGYVHGPDSIVLSLGSSFTSEDDIFEIGGNLLYKVSGNKGVKHKALSANDTLIDMDDAVIEKDSESFMQNIISPSGGWKNAEHLLKLALYGKYNIRGNNWGHVTLYTAFGFNTYFNYSHQAGITEFQPQFLIGAKYSY